MTVQRINDERKFLCLSTDAPLWIPTTVGARVTYTNTGERFIFDGTSWVEDLELIYALEQVFG